MVESGKPTVSVVIPTYNRSGLLGRSIRSVLQQTYGDLEVLVVDDASTDNTSEVVLGIGDKRVRYVRRDTNSGKPAVSRNTGIAASTGRFLAFNDHDDEWLPDKLERQMRVFETAPPDLGVVYSDFWNIRDGTRELNRSPHIMPEDGMIYRGALAFRTDDIFLQSAIVRRECFDVVGMLDEDLRAMDDLEFFIRLSKRYRLYHVAAPLLNRYVTLGSISYNYEPFVRDLETILAKYWEDIRIDRRVTSKHFVNLSWWTHAAGHERKACRYCARAFIASPPECLESLPKYLSGEPKSESINFRMLARAVRAAIRIAARVLAQCPQSLYRMVIRERAGDDRPGSLPQTKT